jgi:hypothetical protein
LRNGKIPFFTAVVLGHDAIEEHGKSHAVHGQRSVGGNLGKGESPLWILFREETKA